MLGIGTADTDPAKQVGIVRARVYVGCAVEHLADLNAATEQFVAGGRDVGDDQVQALGGARCCRGDVVAKDDRASGARRRKLDNAEVITVVVVCVEPPPEPSAVELLRAVDKPIALLYRSQLQSRRLAFTLQSASRPAFPLGRG